MRSAENRRQTIALWLVLALAALLRVTGLSWGLRHAPEQDEALFVRSVVEMIRHHDIEQRFYEYPGLFFQLLRIALAWLPDESLGGARAYVVARGVVAAFGVLSVALAHRLGTKLVSPRAGLVAAIVLAVSPTEVRTAHMVRPDVVLESVALLALLSLDLGKPGARSDVVPGAALGAAVAVKITGIALLPSLLVDRWLRPGARLRGLAVSGLTALVLFLAATPDLFLRPGAFATGFRFQWGYHYLSSPSRTPPMPGLPFYMAVLWEGLGPAACFFGAIGLWKAVERPRAFVPLLAFPLTLLGLLLSSDVHWSRLILPAFGPLAVVAGLGFESVAERIPAIAWGLVLAGSLVPAWAAGSYLRLASQPGTRDLAVDWVEAHVPPRGSVLTSVEGLGVDLTRFQVFQVVRSPTDDRAMAEAVDAVVLDSEMSDLFPTTAPSLVLGSQSKVQGPSLALFEVPQSMRRLRRRVPADRLRLSASSAQDALPLALDGRLDTYWRASERGGKREWFEVSLDREIRLAGVELSLGSRPGGAGRHLRLLVPGGATEAWRPLPATVYSSDPGEDEPAGSRDDTREVLVFEPISTRTLRLQADSAEHHRWGFAEIRIYERADDAAEDPSRP